VGGAARTHELRDLFSQSFGAPTQVYVTGRSLGALITVYLAENFPGAYQARCRCAGRSGVAHRDQLHRQRSGALRLLLSRGDSGRRSARS